MMILCTCPFCGAECEIEGGHLTPMRVICCTNDKGCGAVVSFRTIDYFRDHDFHKDIELFNRRAKHENDD